MIFALFAMILASGVFAFTMNSIGSLVQSLEQKRTNYKGKIVAINNYMNKN